MHCRVFWDANMLITLSLKSSDFWIKSRSIDSTASAFSLSCPIVLQRKDLILFSVLKHQSGFADVMRIVMASVSKKVS